jgi:hypothetical protein
MRRYDPPSYINQPTSPSQPESPEYVTNFQPICPAREDILVPNSPEYKVVLESFPLESPYIRRFPIEIIEVLESIKPKIEDMIGGLMDKKLFEGGKESPFRNHKILPQNFNCYIPCGHYVRRGELDSVMIPLLEQWMVKKALWTVVNVGTLGGIEDGWYGSNTLRYVDKTYLNEDWARIGLRSEVIYRHRETESDRESYRALENQITTAVPVREADGYIRSRGNDSSGAERSRRHSQQMVQGNYETSTASTTSQEAWAAGRGGTVTETATIDFPTTSAGVSNLGAVRGMDGRYHYWDELRQHWVPRS